MFTLPARVLHPFMNCSKVLIKTAFWSCLWVTLPTRVLHPFMNFSFVLIETTIWSCLAATLPARVLLPFMNSFVLIKITIRSHLMVTLPAWILHPFMKTALLYWLKLLLPNLVPVGKLSWTGWVSVLPSISYHPMTMCTYKTEFWKQNIKALLCLFGIHHGTKLLLGSKLVNTQICTVILAS